MSLKEEIGKMDVDLLHIYPQAFWHDDAVVLGNRSALKRLLRTVQRALDIGEAFTEVMTTDGEGYNIYVKVLDEDWSGEKWRTASLPYYRPENFVAQAGQWVPVVGDDNNLIEWRIPTYTCIVCGEDDTHLLHTRSKDRKGWFHDECLRRENCE